MPAAPRHAKPRTSVIRIGAPVVAAATLAGVAAAFVSLHGGPAAAAPTRDSTTVTNAGSAFTTYQLTTAVHRDAAALEAHAVQRAVRRTHLARLEAARHQAARQQAQQAQQAAAQPPPSPSPSPSRSTSPTPSGGGDAASSALGVCIRNAEEGGSYAWGPGNGGGAYQFVLGTWETYGGAASEYGVAGAAYQNQIFDNAIAAGGASNWTDYDGC